MFEVKDSQGNLFSLRIVHQDLVNLQKTILKRPIFKRIIEQADSNSRIATFLEKQIIFSYLPYRDNMFYRALLLVHYALWRAEKDKASKKKIIFFMNRRLCQDELSEYAANHNLKISWLMNFYLDKKMLRLLFLKPSHTRWIKTFINYILNENPIKFLKAFRASQRETDHKAGQPRLAVEYYGRLNLDTPQVYSDLFFWRNSQIAGEDIVITFNINLDPLNADKMAELKKHGMKPLVLNPKASRLSSYPVFYHWPRVRQDRSLANIPNTIEKKWAQQEIEQYWLAYQYWQDLFRRNNIKIHISWYKYAAEQCAIADALGSLGGISTVYQRSYEEFPFPGITVSSEIVFAFSPNNAEVLEKSGSKVPYHVAVGYCDDGLFGAVKEQASQIRSKLERRGAKHILSFFDENCWGDPRWDAAEYYVRENYMFLLEKILAEPELGIVFKPKSPFNLRKHLGPVGELLKEAKKTGRCFVFEAESFNSSYPPALAALSSDIAIHGHMFAGTAAMESALAGVPAVLLDGEGCTYSRWYDLGKGKVVFTDWDSLWEACFDYWKFKGAVPGFGDWSGVLDQLDPFRDGKASERVGTYLEWLLAGFKAGFSRDKVLADSATRYAARWGRDKITEVKPQILIREQQLCSK